MRWYTPEGAEWFSPALAGDAAWQWAKGVDVYMQVGTRELFEDEVKKTARDMRASGVRVRVREVRRMTTNPYNYRPRGAISHLDKRLRRIVALAWARIVG